MSDYITNKDLCVRAFLQFTDEGFNTWMSDMDMDFGTWYNEGIRLSVGDWNWHILDLNEDMYPTESFFEHTESVWYEFVESK